jgi:hypothetical protein
VIIKHRVVTILRWLSLGACLFLIALWMGSWTRERALFVAAEGILPHNTALVISSFHGKLYVDHFWRGSGSLPIRSTIVYVDNTAALWDVTVMIGDRAFLGIGYASTSTDLSTYRMAVPVHVLMCPHWVLVALLGAWPLARRLRRIGKAASESQRFEVVSRESESV